jgi:Fe2+ transport system protein FeoA
MNSSIPLIDLKPGQSARVTACDGIPAAQLAALQAYGILPGSSLVVLQQHPLTIIRVEWTELAFEASVARRLIVEPVRES